MSGAQSGASRADLRHMAGHVNWPGVAMLLGLAAIFYGRNPRVWMLFLLLALAVPLVAMQAHLDCPRADTSGEQVQP